MAKKAISTFKSDKKLKIIKFIKAVKKKEGIYSFKSEIISENRAKEYLK